MVELRVEIQAAFRHVRILSGAAVSRAGTDDYDDHEGELRRASIRLTAR
jgi:hypothetical protein